MPNYSPEKIRTDSSLDKPSSHERGTDTGVSSIDALDGTVENILGPSRAPSEKASEKTSENGSGSVGVGNSSSSTSLSSEQLRETLLQRAPDVPVMRREIERAIEKEIADLHNRAMKLMKSSGKVDFFELNNIARRIRELKKLLSTLVKASVDKVKTLWLRYVHGIM